MNLPIACSVDGSTTVPVRSVNMRGRGGSMHVPSVGPIWYSALNSSTQQQLTSLKGPGVNSRLQDRVVSNSPIPSMLNPLHTQTMTSGNVLLTSASVPVYVEGPAIPHSFSDAPLDFVTQHNIPGGNLTKSLGGDKRRLMPSRSRSLERLGATVSPASRARQVSGLSLPSVAQTATIYTPTVPGT